MAIYTCRTSLSIIKLEGAKGKESDPFYRTMEFRYAYESWLVLGKELSRLDLQEVMCEKKEVDDALGFFRILGKFR